MSSYRIKNIIRKRRSDDESSSDSDVPEIKRPRKSNGDRSTFHMYLLHLKTFASKCYEVLQWISNLPLKDYLKEAMLRRSLLNHGAAAAIDIDEEVNIDDLEDIEIVQELSPPLSKETQQKDSLPKRPYGVYLNPISSSTPFYRDYPSLLGRQSHSVSQKPVNGFRSKSLKSTDRSQKKTSHPKSHYKQRISPLTNPGIDVEILLDGNNQVDKDDDVLEIRSEDYESNLPAAFSKQTLSPIYKLRSSSNDYSVVSQDSMTNSRASAPCRDGRPFRHAFTANEVVRLQEKAQYEQLLERIVNGPPTYKPASLIKSSKKPAVQIDLTEEDDDEPVVGGHFQKELLQKPVDDFLQKYYYKPACLVTPLQPPSRTLKTTQQDDVGNSEQEEEVQIVKIKLPEYKSKSKKTFDFCDPGWINELKKVINDETESQIQKVAEQERKIKRFQKRRDAKNAEQMLLRDQYKLIGADLPEYLVEEDDEFPALSPEMDAIIDSALESGMLSEQLVSMDRLEITRNDINTLSGLSWLNDQIINFYLALIVERSKLDGYPSVHAFNSFFYTSLKTRGASGVLRWTRRIDIFAHDIILVPLHLDMHWALCVIDNRSKNIQYYDSLGSQEDRCLLVFRNYLAVEMNDKKKIVMDPMTYSIETVKDIPQQMNGSDCGMFTLKYAEYVSRDALITFHQTNMAYFRRRMVYEILTKQLL